MKIHIIGLNDEELCLLAVNLKSLGHTVSGSDTDLTPIASNLLLKAGLFPLDLGWHPKRIDQHLDAVLLSNQISKDNPELEKARNLGLKTYSLAEFIYYLTLNITRVLITGSTDTQFPTRILMHVLEYWEKEVDYFLKQDYTGSGSKLYLTGNNDFVIIEAGIIPSAIVEDPPPALHFYPNITLLCGGNKQTASPSNLTSEFSHLLGEFLKSVVPGGSITCNADSDLWSQELATFEAPIRKFPYHPPTISTSESGKLIETSEGWVPVSVNEDFDLQHVEGVRWICQQLGIDAADFYEALSTFG